MRKGKGCLNASWRRKSDVSEGHWAHAIKKLNTFEGDVSTSVVFIRGTMDETGDVQEYNRDVVTSTADPLEEPTLLENFIKKEGRDKNLSSVSSRPHE